MGQLGFSWDARSRNVFAVSEITEQINELVGTAFPDVWIAGEVSGAKLSHAGHWYFNLKDESAQIRCACFKMNAMRLRVKPEDGLQILARGRVEVYAARGEYQLIVEAIEARGVGALQLAFEQLKKKLSEEGLFDASRKRELPLFPQRIGIVTSPTGAAIHDLLNILQRRAPGLHIRLYPAMVQGEGSADQVVRALRYFSNSGWPDVVIVGRGGGSIEDLWTFNEEKVARAIVASAIPVVSAIGHETDFTIADFVADLRAATPSAAAEIVTGNWVAVTARLQSASRHLFGAMDLKMSQARERVGRRSPERLQLVLHRRINRLAQRLDDLDTRLRARDIRLRLQEGKAKLEKLAARQTLAMRSRLSRVRPQLDRLETSVRQLSPLRVLERGYAIVQSGSAVVTDPAQVPVGERIRVRVAKGEFPAVRE